MEEKRENFNYLVRIANTDLNVNKSVITALQKIKGIGFRYSDMVCNLAGIDKLKKIGYLKEEEVKKVEEIITNPLKYKIPSWMMNRRKDPEDGQDRHLLLSNIKFITENDIKLMKKIRCYKGIRHALGQPVRGQRTRSHFRKNKGKPIGVIKSRAAKIAAAEKEKE